MATDEWVYSLFKANVERVKNLVGIYSGLGSGQGRRPVKAADVLRAAVVFLHAALEEYVRGLILEKWPTSGREVLDAVPLAGLNDHGRPEKFLLGQLAIHRHKTVQELIQESVDGYASILNVNNTRDLAELLKKLAIETKSVNQRFADLEALMARRHQIVHQADRNDTPGTGNHWATSLSTPMVNNWIEAVDEFVSAIERERAATPANKALQLTDASGVGS